ncbi:hypothetical protein [Allosphingosinicella sp.]|jgi:hypothetical protein|uniref:hypothetical protein n=1 Tax=Allosphingosinicella sp. TaxID=2823234 RepID=UPI002F18DD50
MKTKLIPGCVLLAALSACNPSQTSNEVAESGRASNGQQRARGTAPAGSEGVAFAEYDQACRNFENVGQMKAGAMAAGWHAYEPEARSHAGQLLRFSDTNVRPRLNGAQFDNWAYRKNAGGRELVLIISQIPTGPASATECRVFDFAAVAPPTDAAIATWAGAAPSDRVAEHGLTGWEWTPGFRDGLAEQSVVYVERNSPLRQELPVVGLGITAVHRSASPN